MGRQWNCGPPMPEHWCAASNVRFTCDPGDWSTCETEFWGSAFRRPVVHPLELAKVTTVGDDGVIVQIFEPRERAGEG